VKGDDVTRLAIVQKAPAFLDRAGCLRIAVAAVAEAAAGGARLVIFPEAFVPGYPAWIWRLRPGGDMALSERLHRALLENAVDLANDDLASLREAAREHQVTVVCGINERDGAFSRGTLYNTVVTIGADGSLLNRHRKLMPTNPERMVWGQGDATGLRPVDSACGRIGALICWENYMPLARYALYAQGIDVYIAPTYDSGDRWIATLQHIAREAGCWVVGSGVAFRLRYPRGSPGHGRSLSRRR
jgi:nitrilase